MDVTHIEKLEKARKLLRGDFKSILLKLDYEEWISLIFLLYDDSFNAFQLISCIHCKRFEEVILTLWRLLTPHSKNFDSAFDPLIEIFYRIGRHDLLSDCLHLCLEHNMEMICENLNCIFPENLALFKVFSNLTQQEANDLLTLRLTNWHRPVESEPLEIVIIRNLDSSQRRDLALLMAELSDALQLEGRSDLALFLQPYVTPYYETRPPTARKLFTSADDDVDSFYAMPDREPYGHCVIINVSHFTVSTDDDESSIGTRHGSSHDRDMLIATFQLLGFSIELLDDPDAAMLDRCFQKLRRDPAMHAMPALAVCVMTHGDTHDKLYLSDRSAIQVDDLRKQCFARAFINKPKMFFVQACRGDHNLFPVLQLQRDAIEPSNSEVDCLISMATVGNHIAMRCQFSGSWYINDLCSSLQRLAHIRPLKDVLQATRKLLKARVDRFLGHYVTQVSEDKDTTTRKIQLRRGGSDSFAEGVVGLLELALFDDLVEEMVEAAIEEAER